MYILVVESHTRTQAIGPFRTAARASGEGLARFGPLVFGNPYRWFVLPIERAK